MVRLARALQHEPRIPTCAQEFSEPHAHTLNTQRPPQHRENAFLPACIPTPCTCAQTDRKNGHAGPTEAGKPSAARPQRTHTACSRAVLCKRRGLRSGKRHLGRARMCGGLSEHCGARCWALTCGSSANTPRAQHVCPQATPTRAAAQHSAWRASSRAARAAARARATIAMHQKTRAQKTVAGPSPHAC